MTIIFPDTKLITYSKWFQWYAIMTHRRIIPDRKLHIPIQVLPNACACMVLSLYKCQNKVEENTFELDWTSSSKVWIERTENYKTWDLAWECICVLFLTVLGDHLRNIGSIMYWTQTWLEWRESKLTTLTGIVQSTASLSIAVSGCIWQAVSIMYYALSHISGM